MKPRNPAAHARSKGALRTIPHRTRRNEPHRRRKHRSKSDD